MYKDIPVIKTFVYNDKYYFYDTYTNRLFEITKNVYTELCKTQRIGISAYVNSNQGNEAYSDVISLINKGVMKSNFIKTIEHQESKWIYFLSDRFCADITLQVTQACNFKCRYCMYANDNSVGRTHQHQHMEWNIAKQTIDYLYNHAQDSENITIAFYGGEPLLNYGLIVDVVNYADSLFYTKKVNYLMTINGSILTDAMMDFFVIHNFSLAISLDGPKDIQDRHRRFGKSGNGTFEVVIKNLIKFQTRYKDFFDKNITFIPVVFEDESYKDVVDFYRTLNISEEKLQKANADLSGIDYASHLRNKENSRIDNVEKKKEHELLGIYANKAPIPSKWHHNGPCIPSIKKMMVSTNGTFYVCEKSIENEELSIGNIYEGVDIKKVFNYLNIGKLTEDECKSCWAMRFCKICVLYCLDIEKNDITTHKKKLACDMMKSDTLDFLKKFIIKS